jgi:hypothetical protein
MQKQYTVRPSKFVTSGLHSTQVLPERFDGRSAKKPVAVVDLEYNETGFEDDDMRDHSYRFGLVPGG